MARIRIHTIATALATIAGALFLATPTASRADPVRPIPSAGGLAGEVLDRPVVPPGLVRGVLPETPAPAPEPAAGGLPLEEPAGEPAAAPVAPDAPLPAGDTAPPVAPLSAVPAAGVRQIGQQPAHTSPVPPATGPGAVWQPSAAGQVAVIQGPESRPAFPLRAPGDNPSFGGQAAGDPTALVAAVVALALLLAGLLAMLLRGGTGRPPPIVNIAHAVNHDRPGVAGKAEPGRDLWDSIAERAVREATGDQPGVIPLDDHRH